MSLGKGLESLIPPRPEDDSGHIESLVAQHPGATGDAAPPEKHSGDNTQPPQPISIPPIPQDIVEDEPAGEMQAYNAPVHPEENISGSVFLIEVDKIHPNPHQPRRDFDENSMRELASSIREFGIIQPLVVSKIEEESDMGWSVKYELIAGERRLKAAKLLGMQTVPVVIRRAETPVEKLELAVIENIQRANLNPIEFARAIARLQDEFALTQREIAVRLGKSREVIANSVRLLGLPTSIQDAIAEGRISESQGRMLLPIDDAAVQESLFNDILKDNLSVREISERVKMIRGSAAKIGASTAPRATANPELSAFRERLEEFFGTKVELKNLGDGGKITISFYSPEELDSIADKLFRQSDNQSL